MTENEYILPLSAKEKTQTCCMCGTEARFISISFVSPICGGDCENALWHQFSKDLARSTESSADFTIDDLPF